MSSIYPNGITTYDPSTFDVDDIIYPYQVTNLWDEMIAVQSMIGTGTNPPAILDTLNVMQTSVSGINDRLLIFETGNIHISSPRTLFVDNIQNDTTALNLVSASGNDINLDSTNMINLRPVNGLDLYSSSGIFNANCTGISLQTSGLLYTSSQSISMVSSDSASISSLGVVEIYSLDNNLSLSGSGVVLSASDGISATANQISMSAPSGIALSGTLLANTIAPNPNIDPLTLTLTGTYINLHAQGGMGGVGLICETSNVYVEALESSLDVYTKDVNFYASDTINTFSSGVYLNASNNINLASSGISSIASGDNILASISGNVILSGNIILSGDTNIVGSFSTNNLSIQSGICYNDFQFSGQAIYMTTGTGYCAEYAQQAFAVGHTITPIANFSIPTNSCAVVDFNCSMKDLTTSNWVMYTSTYFVPNTGTSSFYREFEAYRDSTGALNRSANFDIYIQRTSSTNYEIRVENNLTPDFYTTTRIKSTII
jgi:hypothetical protein